MKRRPLRLKPGVDPLTEPLWPMGWVKEDPTPIYDRLVLDRLDDLYHDTFG